MSPNSSVLVVCRDFKIRGDICRALSGAHLTTHEAEGLQSGLRKFARARPELVFIDADIPDQEGYDLCASIRDSREGRRTPILMAVSRAESAVELANARGASDCILKPFDPVLISLALVRLQNMTVSKFIGRRLDAARRLFRD